MDAVGGLLLKIWVEKKSIVFWIFFRSEWSLHYHFPCWLILVVVLYCVFKLMQPKFSRYGWVQSRFKEFLEFAEYHVLPKQTQLFEVSWLRKTFYFMTFIDEVSWVDAADSWQAQASIHDDNTFVRHIVEQVPSHVATHTFQTVFGIQFDGKSMELLQEIRIIWIQNKFLIQLLLQKLNLFLSSHNIDELHLVNGTQADHHPRDLRSSTCLDHSLCFQLFEPLHQSQSRHWIQNATCCQLMRNAFVNFKSKKLLSWRNTLSRFHSGVLLYVYWSLWRMPLACLPDDSLRIPLQSAQPLRCLRLRDTKGMACLWLAWCSSLGGWLAQPWPWLESHLSWFGGVAYDGSLCSHDLVGQGRPATSIQEGETFDPFYNSVLRLCIWDSEKWAR